ncbi:MULTISPECIES: MMPL family transporter [unclassified Corynebacterium]|uniref:MMPL family transporter n=1 Tax=unclassified Corynebacterium TaxID=2624378 RepID=UPI001EF44CDF|nr:MULTISPECIES: MMPL family transporter [unclassified Corynebacterium]MCG7259357.1 MMPL family transporter [Corynebacterium sp. ACRQK]MCG7263688.1 MMPL family transporter [Corynebacterium sp. ACRQL]
MFSSWGDVAYRFRRLIPLVIIAAILVLYVVAGLKLADRMSQEGWDDPNSQSTKAAQIEQEVFGRDANGDVILMVTGDKPGSATSDEVKQSITQQIEQLRKDHPDEIGGVTSYFNRGPAAMANPDGTAAFASIGLQGIEDDVLINFRKIEDDLRAISAPGVDVKIAGATAVSDSLDEGMAGDIHRAEIYALPAVGLLLLIVFGGLIAAFMPLLVGGLSILGSMGVLAILASFTQINVFAQSVVTLLGLGLAIDYGLFMVSRFREEMAEGHDTRTAVRNTTATAGKTVVFSAAMVAVALSGLFIFPQAFLKSVAFGAISAVGLAALLSVAVLPSVFAMLGPNIDKWSFKKKRTRRRSEQVEGIWGRIPAFAMRHSKLFTVVIVGGMLLMAVPIAGIKLGGMNETYLPPSNQTRVNQEEFTEKFPQFRTDPIKLVIEGDSKTVAAVYKEANAIPGLTAPFQVSRPTKDDVTVLSTGIADRDDNDRIVNALEDINVDGASVYVAGTPALEVESIDALFEKLPWMLLYIVLVSFVLMAMIFGSLIIPAKAVIMNILGTGATLGLLTLIFVDGHGADMFNFTAGPLTSPVLVLIIAIVFGLSTDYEVFLVSRMVEARARGASTDQAIRFGTATTGSIITAAALIMIVVCGAFGFSSIVMMKYIAFGMVIALLLDATIIRMLLVPSVMHLLGTDNWWAPKWVKRLSEKVGHNEQLESSPHEAAPAVRSSRVTVAELSGVDAIAPVPAQRPGEAPARQRNLPFAELMRRVEESRSSAGTQADGGGGGER